MTKQAPVQTLLDLSILRLDEATRKLGTLISGEQTAAERLKLLADYRTEYHTRFMAAAQSGISREIWRNYQTFLERLDISILQAEEAVKQSRQRTSLGQREWQGKNERVRAFDMLTQRHLVREQYAAQRLEQKAQDEFAAHKFEKREEN